MTDWTPQPFIQDAIVCLRAPLLVLSTPDGQLRGGAAGFFASDTRWVSRLVLTIDGAEPEAIHSELLGTRKARFVAVRRSADDPTPDPAVSVERLRSAEQDCFEQITLSNHGRIPVALPLRLETGCDLANIFTVKSGRTSAGLPAENTGSGLSWTHPRTGVSVTLTPSAVPDRIDPATGGLEWTVDLAPGQSWTVSLALVADRTVDAPTAVTAPATDRGPWSDIQVRCADPRMSLLLGRSLDDLEGLLLSDPLDPTDHFLAAGAPWYLTLFGRDSLWAARMMLPLGTELAASTLRTLARRQGTANNPDTEEQPGKILHELRRETTRLSGGLTLPPLYYGSIDATLLFVVLLAEAWRWGMPQEEVAALLPHAERALEWLRSHADADGDGFVEYIRNRENGLVNQGWKDSVDAVQTTRGRLAVAPIALSEVQGYAYQAAIAGAALLSAFERPGADYWLDWADSLARRFRSAFWVEDAAGPYIAIALDGDKRPVDAVASNAGHLLGTGILSAEESALVALRLNGPDMNSGWGLRTMSARSTGFNPIGYHTGSVWAHDTAIAVAGLAASGHHGAAASLLEGLLEAAVAFDYRLPELHAGEQRRTGGRPVPYPASCRPQAWAATAGVSLLSSLLGLEPDLPTGRVTLRPLAESPVGSVEVSGIRLGADAVTVKVDGRGNGSIVGAPGSLHVETRPPATAASNLGTGAS